MIHSGTIELNTERLLLRKFEMNDANAVYHNWANDERVTEFLRWPAHKSIEVTMSVLSGWIKSYDNMEFYQWAIIFKEHGDDPIGSISVVDMKEKLDIVTIGYCIGSKWWNQGITSEAFSGIIPFLFDEVKVNRIEAQHDPKNPNSGRVMLKCGLKYEGTLRQAGFNNKGITDEAMYSLLACDYYTT